MPEKIQCIVVDDEPVARGIIESYLEKIQNIHLVKSCKNAAEAFEILTANSIDLIFLDINMPEISGLSLAKSVKHRSKIIFTTAYREYAVEGFDLQAVDYLLKPISFDRFLQAVQNFFELNIHQPLEKTLPNESPKSNYMFVRSDRKMIKLTFDDILYIESLSDYLKIHTKEKTIITRETISNIESKLPVNEFLRVHRSYIISLDKILSYTNEYIEIEKKAIPISRSYKENVLKKLTGS